MIVVLSACSTTVVLLIRHTHYSKGVQIKQAMEMVPGCINPIQIDMLVREKRHGIVFSLVFTINSIETARVEKNG